MVWGGIGFYNTKKIIKQGIESFFLQKNIMKKILEMDLKNLELNTLN